MFKPLRLIRAFVVSAMLTGCGTMDVYRESQALHQELLREAASDYERCTGGGPTTMNHNRSSGQRDCFDLVVRSAPQRIGQPQDDAAFISDNAYAYIDRVALMALFSNMVYHGYELENERGKPHTCTRNVRDHPLSSLYRGSSAAAGAGRWELWADGKLGCYTSDGLYFETYVYYPEGSGQGKPRFTQAVIAFRGTENGEQQRWIDWPDNFAAALGHPPPQHVAAAAVLERSIAGLFKEGERGLKIVTTGHSLGGGLAQMAAYLSPHVSAAFVFNSSPVTGWTWLRDEARRRQFDLVENPQIFRVSQRGEALGVLRSVSSAVESDRFGRADYEFDFRFKSAADLARSETWLKRATSAAHEHSIGLLACHMAARVFMAHSGRHSTAAFDYRPEMALNVLQGADRPVYSDEQMYDGRDYLCTPKNIAEINAAVAWRASLAAPQLR